MLFRWIRSPLLLCAALPGLLQAQTPSIEQAQAAMEAAVAAERDNAPGTASAVAAAMFAPHLRELPYCQHHEQGVADCIAGADAGMKRRYRMLRLQPDGDGWRVLDVRPPAPTPPLAAAQAWLAGEIGQALAEEADPAARRALAADIGDARAQAIEHCALRSEAAELDCAVRVQSATGEYSRTVRFQLREGRWQGQQPG
ncbi:hypothetical protein [Stenotrophomonas sp. 24(2023)]|uniref:hypothetical protein n=1 Tax=Stenotrophomonas sp. 24(2023) TaxID=3068324 RepID=UPI0027E197D4|nr:hypothetical protein [Stenotrophomonas sp. 24(2023)]WMJ70084.1 hypothetical protein Q9R17_02960 [Stenotrophomonas sp. 24(2023)]